MKHRSSESSTSRPETYTRRKFLAKSLAATTLTIVPGSVLGRTGRTPPSERLTLGIVGVGGQGIVNAKTLLKHDDVQIISICDVNRESELHWDPEGMTITNAPEANQYLRRAYREGWTL